MMMDDVSYIIDKTIPKISKGFINQSNNPAMYHIVDYQIEKVCDDMVEVKIMSVDKITCTYNIKLRISLTDITLRTIGIYRSSIVADIIINTVYYYISEAINQIKKKTDKEEFNND